MAAESSQFRDHLDRLYTDSQSALNELNNLEIAGTIHPGSLDLESLRRINNNFSTTISTNNNNNDINGPANQESAITANLASTNATDGLNSNSTQRLTNPLRINLNIGIRNVVLDVNQNQFLPIPIIEPPSTASQGDVNDDNVVQNNIIDNNAGDENDLPTEYEILEEERSDNDDEDEESLSNDSVDENSSPSLTDKPELLLGNYFKVSHVLNESPGWTAGFKPDDRVVKFGDMVCANAQSRTDINAETEKYLGVIH